VSAKRFGLRCRMINIAFLERSVEGSSPSILEAQGFAQLKTGLPRLGHLCSKGQSASLSFVASTTLGHIFTMAPRLAELRIAQDAIVRKSACWHHALHCFDGICRGQAEQWH